MEFMNMMMKFFLYVIIVRECKPDIIILCPIGGTYHEKMRKTDTVLRM